MEDYIAQEESNSDMFLFLKYVNPILFSKIAVADTSSTAETLDDDEYKSQLNTAR